MANQEHFEKLREGVEGWNHWRKKNPGLQPDLQGARLRSSQLQKADLRDAQLQKADLTEAQLQGAHLTEAQLQGADLNGAQLQGADLNGAQLQGADLGEAFFDNATSLKRVILGDEKYGSALLADVSWGGANLAVVDWSPLEMLGDEYLAQMLGDEYQIRRLTGGYYGIQEERKKDEAKRLEAYRGAVRANRQLAVALRDQGLNEDADRFAYRAQVLQWRVFWEQKNRQGKNSGVGFFPGFLLWWRVMVTGWSAFSLHMP